MASPQTRSKVSGLEGCQCIRLTLLCWTITACALKLAVFQTHTVFSMRSSRVARYAPSELKHTSATPSSLGSELGFTLESGGEKGCDTIAYDRSPDADTTSCHIGACRSGGVGLWSMTVWCSIVASGVKVRVLRRAALPSKRVRPTICELPDQHTDLMPRPA